MSNDELGRRPNLRTLEAHGSIMAKFKMPKSQTNSKNENPKPEKENIGFGALSFEFVWDSCF
jgi:hypothetical protein